MDVLLAAQAETDARLAALQMARAHLQTQAANLGQRSAELDRRKAELAERHGTKTARGSDRLKLNVGGANVVATRSTLTLYPESLLGALFSGRWDSRLPRDKQGRIFLDIDPTCFKKILDFLNLLKISSSDEPPPLPKVPREMEHILSRMVTFLGLGELLPVPPAIHIDNTIIMNRAHLDMVTSWLAVDGKNQGLELLYRASRDGWRGTEFHSKCDDRGPTVTLAKVAGPEGFIIGGYLDQPWNSNNGYFVSSKAFLFTLHCSAGLGPTKMPLKGSNNEYAANGSSSYGPTFGGGHDLHIADNANASSSSYANVGHTYVCPLGQTGRTFVTGTQNFQVAEVEVFCVVAADCSHQFRTPAVAAPAAAFAHDSPVHMGSDARGAEWEAVHDAIASFSVALEAERKALFAAEQRQVAFEEQFEQEAGLVNSLAVESANDIVDLCVSGERITVRRSTLMLCAESALARKFDNKVWSQLTANREVDEDEVSGSETDDILIEHSAYCFGKIIDQLRLKAMVPSDETLPPPRIASHERDNFERIVKYYFPGVEDFILGFAPFAFAETLSKEHAVQLGVWVGPCTSELLYRASRDGWRGQDFHSRCDNQGSTVTVVRSTGGFIFGGYLDQSWRGCGGYALSTRAFLFVLHCSVGLAPTKLLLSGPNNSYAANFGPNYGPTFGGGYDMHIADSANMNSNSYANIGHTYHCPPGQTGRTFVTGTENFQVQEVEVFRVQVRD
mmetsp:Transcript_32027/g.88488  ORF Transcript_32027/g.88488 Transcript_32027/m.88488 type:complete len:731 (+) Transcript_32027:106-2298(+)